MGGGSPAVGVVEVGEEQHPAAEEGEQNHESVESVQNRVLFLKLKEDIFIQLSPNEEKLPAFSTNIYTLINFKKSKKKTCRSLWSKIQQTLFIY